MRFAVEGKQHNMKTKILLLFAVIVLLVALTEGRRVRIRFRFSSRSRYSSSSRSRYVSKFSANRISSKSNLRTAILLGTVYGATRWRRRSSFKSKGDLPEICYNDRYDRDGNFSYYGRFLCPTDDSMGDDYRYCCGEEGQQYCCTFWGGGGRVADVVIGILVFVVIVFVTCYCCIKRCKCKKSLGSVLRTPSKNNNQMATIPMAYHPMGTPKYPGAQNQPSGAPPSYESTGPATGGLPYDPDPNPSVEKPPLSNDGSLPYPIDPTNPSAPPPSAPPCGVAPYLTGNPPYPPTNASYPN